MDPTLAIDPTLANLNQELPGFGLGEGTPVACTTASDCAATNCAAGREAPSPFKNTYPTVEQNENYCLQYIQSYCGATEYACYPFN